MRVPLPTGPSGLAYRLGVLAVAAMTAMLPIAAALAQRINP